MYALCGRAKVQRGTCCWRAVLARSVPHALMFVFQIRRFITANQYDKVCVACLWVGGCCVSLAAPPPMHKYPKASTGVQHLDKSVHAYVLQRRNVGYAERGWFCRLLGVSLFSDATSRMPRPLSARSTTIKRPRKVSPSPVDLSGVEPPSVWRCSMS